MKLTMMSVSMAAQLHPSAPWALRSRSSPIRSNALGAGTARRLQAVVSQYRARSETMVE
jgi:hypothetical protein